MKIWMDLTNAPHVNIFSSVIAELRVEHEVIITTRDHSNTLSLLEAEKLNFIVVGRHYGASISAKLFGFLDRVYRLWKALHGAQIDVAISHSSFYSPLVARLLGARSIYLNDNEHALGNIPAFIFADLIMIPETVSLAKITRQGARKAKVIQYPGVKEAIYLSSHSWQRTAHSSDKARKSIYIRPEPWNAQYYKGDKAFLDNLIIELSKHYSVTVLPRGRGQGSHYEELQISGLKVISSSMPLPEICKDCDLFIGAGGTMTRELAILGVPTISVYQDELLDVDKYLIEKGYMIHNLEPNLSIIKRALEENKRDSAHELMEKGKRARQLIMDKLLELGAKKY